MVMPPTEALSKRLQAIDSMIFNITLHKSGFLKLFCCATHLKKIFPRRPLIDSLDVNDTCKRPISLQKHLHLVCQANLLRDSKLIFRDPKWGRDP